MVAYSEDVCLLEESMNNINTGTEALLDTRKDINLKKERKQMHVPNLDENKYVNTKTLTMLQHSQIPWSMSRFTNKSQF
jgi:hypothetical protein